MTKQEYIQQAYGEYYDKVKDFVDEDGWCTMFRDDKKLTPTFKELGFSEEYVITNITPRYDQDSYSHKWRFNTLNSLEDNNGWIRINNESDLPDKNSTKRYDCGILDEFGLFHEKGTVSAKYLGTLYRNYSYTHYKPFVKQRPPVY